MIFRRLFNLGGGTPTTNGTSAQGPAVYGAYVPLNLSGVATGMAAGLSAGIQVNERLIQMQRQQQWAQEWLRQPHPLQRQHRHKG